MELKKTKNMNIKKVMIAGGGTLGSQIAWQTAFNGFEVIVYDAFEKGLERSKAFHQQFADLFLNTRGASKEEVKAALSRLTYTTDIAEAAKDADRLSESVPEDPKIKSAF
jgi:3-hydroxybutyryl-CoA dehydrogenase